VTLHYQHIALRRQLCDRTKKRLTRRFYKLLMRKDYQDLILRYLKEDEIRFDTGIQPKPLIRDISIIEKLLSQPETKIWYDSYLTRSHNDTLQRDKNFKSLLTSVDTRLSEYSDKRFKTLYIVSLNLNLNQCLISVSLVMLMYLLFHAKN